MQFSRMKTKQKTCKSNGGISLALFAQKAIASLEGDVTEPRFLFQWEKALQEMLQLLDILWGLAGMGCSGNRALHPVKHNGMLRTVRIDSCSG